MIKFVLSSAHRRKTMPCGTADRVQGNRVTEVLRRTAKEQDWVHHGPHGTDLLRATSGSQLSPVSRRWRMARAICTLPLLGSDHFGNFDSVSTTTFYACPYFPLLLKCVVLTACYSCRAFNLAVTIISLNCNKITLKNI